jgi:hypothetical protein
VPVKDTVKKESNASPLIANKEAVCNIEKTTNDNKNKTTQPRQSSKNNILNTPKTPAKQSVKKQVETKNSQKIDQQAEVKETKVKEKDEDVDLNDHEE